MAKIFVSYTSKDSAEAAWVARELRKLGHTPFLHEEEIKGGESFMAWMGRRMDDAEHALCLMSPEYFTAKFSKLEYDAALTEATRKGSNFLLPVIVRPCEVPKLVGHLNRCALHSVIGDEKLALFHAFINRSANPDPAPASKPASAGAFSNIPIHVPEHFLGRDEALTDIHAALSRHEGRVAITALHGLRGVGKTVLAAAYADRHARDYRATWWIRAETESGMRADLVGLGVRLGWVDPEEKEEPAVAAIMERLAHEGDGILLIYDNAVAADAIRPYLPRGGAARVLVTSNAPNWRDVAAPIQIGVWPKEVGAEFLVRRTGRETEREAAEALSEALGGLPLAHEQAAAYCERLEIPLAEYAKRFAAEPARLLDAEKDAPAEYHDKLTVAKTFALAIDAAAKLHPAAEPLIVHAALLAPESIPLFLFAEGRERFGEPLASALAGDGLDEVVSALRAFALVDRETIADERDPTFTTHAFRLHRLVREVAATRCVGAALTKAGRTLVEAISTVYPSSVYDDPRAWRKARRLDALAVALVSDHTPPKGVEETASRLLDRLASYRESSLAAYTQARLLYEHALLIREKVLGPEHPRTAASLNNLAGLVHRQGDLRAARSLYERALAILKKERGSEDPDVATTLNNFAMLLRDQGDFAGAEPLYARALAIREKAFGPEHPDTAASLNNLAGLLYARGDLV